MTNNNWYQDLIEQEKNSAAEYEKRALLQYVSEYLVELDKRIEQKEGQLDGELWNHEEW